MVERYFCTVTQDSRVFTLSVEARSAVHAKEKAISVMGGGITTASVDRGARAPCGDGMREGARIALESMNLPDGAHLAMAEEFGVPIV